MKKRVLILGAGFMQGIAISCAKEKGWEVVAVDGNPQAVCKDLAHRFEPIDLKDLHGLSVLARSLKDNGGLDGVFTAATDFSASVAWVASEIGLPGHSYEAACNASDKIRMRSCFARDGVPSPLFISVNADSRSSVSKRIAEKGIMYPFIVKPVDNMGGRGCRRVSSESELDPALSDALVFSRSGTAIIEEIMEGPEFSVEGLFYDNCLHITGLADRHIYFPPYFIEMGHTIPSSCSLEIESEIYSVFDAGIRSLGLSHGAVKGDIKLTPRGVMIGEIAGRLSGGYMSGWTFPYSSGVDLTSAALDLAVGNSKTVDLTPPLHLISAERAWISIPGRIAYVSGIQKARTIPFVRDIYPRLTEGNTAVFPQNNVEKAGNCIAVAPTREEAIFAAEQACREIFVRLLPNVKETDLYINSGPLGPGHFPPDAFDIPLESLKSEPVVHSPDSFYIPKALSPFLDTAKDWQGRTLRESLQMAVSVEEQIGEILSNSQDKSFLLLWKALIRGGVQALVYVYDSY